MSPAASRPSDAPGITTSGQGAGSQGLKVSTSPRPGSRLAVEVGVPGSRCQASYEAAIAKLSRSIRLPGFRQGKIPPRII